MREVDDGLAKLQLLFGPTEVHLHHLIRNGVLAAEWPQPAPRALGCRRRQTTLAGFPNTTTFGGTFEATTDPAPTTELAPMFTPFSTMAPAPIQALAPIETGLERPFVL